MIAVYIIGGLIILGLIIWGLQRLIVSKGVKRLAQKVEDVKDVIKK